MNREIRFYRTEAGYSPVAEFLDSLDSKQAQKVAWVLRLIEELESVPARYLKKLVNAGDIWEVRIDSGRATFRLLGFFDGPRIVVLVHGVQKKTQKTPQPAIALAQERRREYFRGKEHE